MTLSRPFVVLRFRAVSHFVSCIAMLRFEMTGTVWHQLSFKTVSSPFVFVTLQNRFIPFFAMFRFERVSSPVPVSENGLAPCCYDVSKTVSRAVVMLRFETVSYPFSLVLRFETVSVTVFLLRFRTVSVSLDKKKEGFLVFKTVCFTCGILYFRYVHGCATVNATAVLVSVAACLPLGRFQNVWFHLRYFSYVRGCAKCHCCTISCSCLLAYLPEMYSKLCPSFLATL